MTLYDMNTVNTNLLYRLYAAKFVEIINFVVFTNKIDKRNYCKFKHIYRMNLLKNSIETDIACLDKYGENRYEDFGKLLDIYNKTSSLYIHLHLYSASRFNVMAEKLCKLSDFNK